MDHHQPLRPIEKKLKFLRIFGGFPLIIENNIVTYSSCQVFKILFVMAVGYLSLIPFAVFGLTQPSSNFWLYRDIFVTIGFSQMDYIIGWVLFGVNMFAASVNFVALKSVAIELTQLCHSLQSFSMNYFFYREQNHNMKGKTEGLQNT